MVFNFLNLNAGWIHRKDRADTPAPWRAPTVMIGAGAVLAFFNALLLGWGANIWGPGALATGSVFAALIIPVFCYRHFVQDKGVFPTSMYDTGDERDDIVAGGVDAAGAGSAVLTSGPPVKRAGILPYLTLAGGVVTVVIGQLLSSMSGCNHATGSRAFAYQVRGHAGRTTGVARHQVGKGGTCPARTGRSAQQPRGRHHQPGTHRSVRPRAGLRPVPPWPNDPMAPP